MTDSPDKLHYLRIPKAQGGRAEAVRLCYALPRCGTSGCEMERARLKFSDATGELREGAVVDVYFAEY